MEGLDDTNKELQDYWNEYRILQEYKPPQQDAEDEHNTSANDAECSDERDWLETAGLSEVTEPAFLSGREVSEFELSSALRLLSREQAAAVRRRVDSLNKTVRQKTGRYKQRKDIRSVFGDLERLNYDSRSRSATPDSLNSGPPSPSRDIPNGIAASPPRAGLDHTRLQSILMRQESRRREAASNTTPVLPNHNLFRRSNRLTGDVASETADGIRMTSYQRIGSVRVRCGSDPMSINKTGQEPEENLHPVVCVTRSDEGIFSDCGRRHSGGSSPSDNIGFQEMLAGERLCESLNCSREESVAGRTWVDFLAEEDLQTLRPLVFLELTALMDNAGLRVGKTKPHKRKRKEDGNLFGVSLSNLLEKDQQIVSETQSVPLVFQKVLGELEKRCLWEKGLLRVSGNSQRVELLCSKLEREFYQRPEVGDHLISTAQPHDLANVLKKLLRELPQPLLTSQFLSTFYQCHSIPDRAGAINLLVLLLPPEHRATLRNILQFLSSVINNCASNKMSSHNVAMIMAPSLFPPDILVEKGGLKAELDLAVHCCGLTEFMVQALDKLWVVPDNLVAQLRRINDTHKENKPKSKLLGRKGQVVTRSVVREAEFNGKTINIEAPQFLFSFLPLVLDKQTTAAHVILRVVELARDCPRNIKSTRRDAKSRALSELAPNGNLSCLLSTGDPDTALQTHFLYEVGGNIGQRRLEPGAILWAVHQSNPRAKWIIKCDHRNGSHRLLRRV